MSVAARHVYALDALLRVGQRSARNLAAEATLPPKVAIEELVAQGETILADARTDALAEAEPAILAAADDEAAVERLEEQLAHVDSLRNDPDGSFRADRLWLGTLAGLVLLGLILALAIALVAHGMRPGAVESMLVVALTGVVAAAAGDWAGRARDRRLLAAALAALGLLALGAALVVGIPWTDRSQYYAVEALAIVACGCAGYLMGRARHVAPRIRESDRVRRLQHELALAKEQVRRSSAQLDALERRYAASVDQIGGRVLRTVEEYLKAIEDSRAASVLAGTSVLELRRTAAARIAAWPRSLR
jgi:hypothetical protein